MVSGHRGGPGPGGRPAPVSSLQGPLCSGASQTLAWPCRLHPGRRSHFPLQWRRGDPSVTRHPPPRPADSPACTSTAHEGVHPRTCHSETPPASALPATAGGRRTEGDSRVPSEVRGVDVEDAGSGDGGRGGRPQVADLEHQPHGAVQGDALVAGQREHLATGRGTGHRPDGVSHRHVSEVRGGRGSRRYAPRPPAPRPGVSESSSTPAPDTG